MISLLSYLFTLEVYRAWIGLDWIGLDYFLFRMYVHVCVCVCVCERFCVCIYTDLHTYRHSYVCMYKSVCMHTYCFNKISIDKIEQSINNSIPESNYEKGEGGNFIAFLSCKNNDFS